MTQKTVEQVIADLEKRDAQIADMGKKLDALEDELLKRGRNINEKTESKADLEYRTSFDGYMKTGKISEFRGLHGADSSDGGALVPEDYKAKVIDNYQSRLTLQNLVNVEPTGRDKVYAPVVLEFEEAEFTDGAPKVQTIDTSETVDADIHKVKVLIKLKQDTVDDAAVNVMDVVSKRSGYALARAVQRAILLGTGNKQPFGILNCDAIVSRAINTGAANGLPATDKAIVELINELIHSVAEVPSESGKFFMNLRTRGKLANVMDGTNTKLIKDNKIFGFYEIVICDHMPDIAAGKLPILFGDMAAYTLFDRQQLLTKVITGGDYDTNGLIGYLVTMRLGGKVIKPDGFSVLKVSE